MNKFFSAKNFDLPTLLELIEKGEIQLPEFQREFNWPYQKRKQLIQSLQKGFPTGTLLFLEVDREPSFSCRKVVHTISDGNPRFLALDGQQRLSSISQAFLKEQTSDFVFYLNLKKLHEKSPENSNEIDLHDDGIIEVLRKNEARNSRTALFEQKLFSLDLVFDNEQRPILLSEYTDRLNELPENAAFRSFIQRRFENFLENIKRYEYPVVIINKEANLEVVSTIFTEINTMGLKLTSFDLCVAKFFKESRGSYHLRNFLKTKKEEIRDLKIVDENGTAFLQTVALMAEKDNKKSKLSSSLTFRDLETHGENAINALSRTAEQLKNILAIEKNSNLPYPPLVPALAICMHSFPRRTTEQPQVQKRIKKWILASGITQRYVEGADVVQKKDLSEVIPWVLGGGPEPSFVSEPWSLNEEFLRMSANSARGKVLMLVLRLIGAAGSDFYELSDSEFDSHHIFPKKFLSENNPDADSECFLNRTIISKRTNQSISGKAPSDYISEIKEMRFPGLQKAMANQKMAEILQKHLINSEAYVALLNNNYRSFIENRALAFATYIQQEFGVPFVRTAGDSADTPPFIEEEDNDEG